MRIFCGCLLIGFTIQVVKSAEWIDDLTRYIINDSGARQVTLITELGDNDALENRQIHEIFVKLGESIPILRIELGDLDFPKESMDNVTEDFKEIDTTDTFYLLVHESDDGTSVLPSNLIIDGLLDRSTFQYHPRYLVLLISHKLSASLEELLKYTWSRKVLDITIVEITESSTNSIDSILNDPFVGSLPIIHQYNPFEDNYTATNWTKTIEWFPDKVSNMFSHPLKIGVANRPPFSIAKFDGLNRPVYVTGNNIIVIKTIAERLNFSLKYMPQLISNDVSNPEDPTSIYDLMGSGKIDLLGYLSPHYTQTNSDQSLRTNLILFDQLCPVVPIMPTLKLPMTLSFFSAYMLGSGVVLIFWIIRHPFKLEPRLFQPFNIVRLLFGVSVTRLPIANGERTMFACLFVVSGIFSTTFYTSLTGISLQTDAHREFKSFEDLDASGLIPVISKVIYNKTFMRYDEDDDNDAILASLAKKTVQNANAASMYRCAWTAARHQNVTCLMRKSEAKVAVIMNERGGKARIKIASPCFWADSTAFLLSKGSPYRSRIDKIITRMQDSGLIGHWYERPSSNATSEADREAEKSSPGSRQNMIALMNQLTALMIFGNGFAIVAFVAEIIIDRAIKYRQRSKRRIFD